MTDADLLERLAAAARDAGARIVELYEVGYRVSEKLDRSPVTEADLAAEAIILAALADCAPGVPVVAEESCAAGRVPAVGRRFFLVDPLDGTKDFVAGGRDFTVNIALIEEGLPKLGVVQVPINGTLYGGIVGEGTWRERGDVRVPIRVRDVPADGPVALLSRSHLTEPTTAWLDARGVSDRRPVGSSLKYCLIAAGEADLSVRHGPTAEWDTAAGHAVLLAAGGRMETLDGEPLTYGKPGFLNPGLVALGR
ncbi:MAG: 3'(2'),5'-bisphosphate nucleotidase [uncultured Sphingomonadaceae bacterium]|uniref:3'(2'),5'-bisphosphate nucleotidase CysQ n=1 Tax=uncultured Sphingomonadaceae bacterium TaxID=169976 RepID=A0A6J4SQP2_9SPHN|nr:MAG: 3'(2'),5'-bisphosphate nucleotidase [uncultured Sphingomonadaceae bacterium]